MAQKNKSQKLIEVKVDKKSPSRRAFLFKVNIFFFKTFNSKNNECANKNSNYL